MGLLLSRIQVCVGVWREKSVPRPRGLATSQAFGSASTCRQRICFYLLDKRACLPSPYVVCHPSFALLPFRALFVFEVTTHRMHRIVRTSKCNHECLHSPPSLENLPKQRNKCFGSHHHVTTYQKHRIVRSSIHCPQLFAAPPCIHRPPLQLPKQRSNVFFGSQCNITSQLHPQVNISLPL